MLYNKKEEPLVTIFIISRNFVSKNTCGAIFINCTCSARFQINLLTVPDFRGLDRMSLLTLWINAVLTSKE